MFSSPPLIPLQQQERTTGTSSEELLGGQHHRQQLAQAIDPLNFSRNENNFGSRDTTGGGGSLERGGKTAGAGGAPAGDVSEHNSEFLSALQAFASAGVGVPRRAGVELTVPGVVNDSDYRLRLSTGIKFCDTHMITVLDETRVLLDEIVIGEHDEAAGVSADGGNRCQQGGETVYLSAEGVDTLT